MENNEFNNRLINPMENSKEKQLTFFPDGNTMYNGSKGISPEKRFDFKGVTTMDTGSNTSPGRSRREGLVREPAAPL